jgi:O-antigen ligase
VWSGAIAAWGAALGIVFTDALGWSHLTWLWLGGACGLLVWTILSTVWSAHPAQSVLEARRTVVYVAVAFALVVLARRGATRLLVASTHVAVAALVIYALARYLLGPRSYDPFEAFLLSQPLGYANAVGVLASLGVALGLGILRQAESRTARAAAAATVPPLALALVLTGSDGAWLALAVGLAAMALLDPSPAGLVRAAATVAPATVLVIWLGRHSGLSNPAVVSPRFTGGLVALIVTVCAVGTAAIAARLRPPAAGRGSPLTRRIVVVAVVCAALGGGALVARAGSTQPRASYWHVAWHDEYRSHPMLGTGAGTFAIYWARSGEELAHAGALDAHSLYLETLAELGPIGVALLAVTLLAPLAAAVRRRTSPYVPAAAGAYIAFLVHAGLDWDWEMPAVVVAALACAAALLIADDASVRRMQRALRIAALVLALTLGGCAIAGARSHTVPAAAPTTTKAPRGGAFSNISAVTGR